MEKAKGRMPELPEVETVRRGLVPVLEGAVIHRVEQRRPDLRSRSRAIRARLPAEKFPRSAAAPNICSLSSRTERCCSCISACRVRSASRITSPSATTLYIIGAPRMPCTTMWSCI